MTLRVVARHNVAVAESARSDVAEADTSSRHEDEVPTSSYTRAVGSRLRSVRQQRHLSLQAVEAMSSQEFKASVLGAYERGERAISVPRLQRLALLYDVPVDFLLPPPNGDVTEGASSKAQDGLERGMSGIEAQLGSIQGPERELLRRFVQMIQAQRRSHEGTPVGIRAEDLKAIELLLGSSTRGRSVARPD